jgi:hypothetical protein
MANLALLASLFAASASLSHNALFIASAVQEGETVTIGNTIFEIDTNGAVTVGNVAVDLSTSSAAAAGAVLTLSGNAVAAETVTIGAVVYTWATTPTTTANQVKVGASAAESIDNLVAAINLAAGAGTLYGSATVIHPTVSAVRSASTCVLTAKVKGTAGNALASTETMTNAAFGGAVFTGGVDATASQAIAALIATINQTLPKTKATAISGGLLVVDTAGRGPLATTETLAGANNNWMAAATFGNDPGGAIPNIASIFARAATAAEVTAGRFFFSLPATPIVYSVQVRTSAGVVKAWDGAVGVVGNTLQIDNTGSTDIAANDLVIVTFAL